jgi:hypothetical protein
MSQADDNQADLSASGKILEDRSVSMEGALFYLFVLAGPLVLLQAGFYSALWGWRDLRGGLHALLSLRLGGPVFILGILLHEFIHGLTWKLVGPLSWREIRFGFQLRSFSPYAHPAAPLPARAYRIGTLMPLIALGAMPFLVGLAIAEARLTAFGMVFTFVAGGDLAILWLLRGVPPRSWVQDHSSRAGCYVVTPSQLTSR